MRLSDLNPRWWTFESDGPRVGLTFDCPHCRHTRLGVVFHHRGHEAIEDVYIRAHSAQCIWTADGEDFETLTLSPSVDVSAHGHWHGFLRNGEITC